MVAYWVARSKVNNPDQYKKYTDLVPGILEKFGGKILARGGKFKILEGPEKFHRFVVIEFPSFEKAVACHESPEYLEAAAHRKRTARASWRSSSSRASKHLNVILIRTLYFEQAPRSLPRAPSWCDMVSSVDGLAGAAATAAITFARSPSASKLMRRKFASWDRKAYSCARSSPLQARKRRVLAFPVLYRSGAPEEIRSSATKKPLDM